MPGMRNRIAHGYFEIYLATVWDTLRTALPSLQTQLRAIIGTKSSREASLASPKRRDTAGEDESPVFLLVFLGSGYSVRQRGIVRNLIRHITRSLLDSPKVLTTRLRNRAKKAPHRQSTWLVTFSTDLYRQSKIRSYQESPESSPLHGA